MKVLLFTNTDWSLYNFRVPLAKELRKMDHKVVMVSPSGKFVPNIEEAGFRHISVKISRTGMNPIKEFQTVWELKKIFQREQPDVVHSFTPKGVLYGSTAAKWEGINHVVNSITGLGYMFEKERDGIKTSILQSLILTWYKVALPNTDVIFQNKEDLQFLDQQSLLDKANTHVIRSSGVDVQKFFSEYVQNDIPIIGLPARMVRAKGIETFIQAAEKLKKQKVNARFVLAGKIDPTREDSYSEEDLKKWHEKDVIEWWGFQDDMPGFYNETSIICLPSYGKEGVPRALIEAAAAGKPIVTTDNTGCRDAVLDGETGYLVPVKDSDSLANSLVKLIKNKKLRRRMGQRGREYAKKTFALDIIAKQTANIYSAKVRDRVYSN